MTYADWSRAQLLAAEISLVGCRISFNKVFFFVTMQEGGGAILYHIDQCDVIVLVLHFSKVRGATAPLSHLGSCIANMFFLLKNITLIYRA